ncbi:MAG: ATP-binding cassette domain-containing protein, partial [Candidatus Eremiobacteraeota bacterium]|nr:ATP-binding cassette domain-containing protein [Candidatus Eremiobacteraeota bacterium]
MSEHIVDVRDVVKVHAPGTPTEVRALDGVTFGVKAGDYVAIVGESGSGKTTLMHVLGGLDRPTSGDVVIDGRSLARTSRGELAAIRAHAIGFVFQGFNLLPNMDARENVALAARYAGFRGEASARAERALRDVGLGDRMHHRPSALSGG